MAPRRGSGSGSSSGGGGGTCDSCTEPLYLWGYFWQNPEQDAYFAIQIILLVVLPACLYLSTRFTWRKALGKRDVLQNTGYKVAATIEFLAYLLAVVDIGLRESGATTTRLYYILLIFQNLFYMTAECLMLAIILRIPCEYAFISTFRKFTKLHIGLMVVVGLFAMAIFGMNTAWYAQAINLSLLYEYEIQVGFGYAYVVYRAFIFLISIVILVENVTVVLKDRSKTTLIMGLLVAPALFIRNLLQMVWVALTYTIAFMTASEKSVDDLLWANVFFNDLSNIAIFLGVVLAGWFLAKRVVEYK